MRLRLVVSMGCRLLRRLTAVYFLSVIKDSRKPLVEPRKWIEVPVVSDELAISDQPKYSIEGSALVVYHGSKAYVTFRNANDLRRSQLTQNPDVRLLTSDESLLFEANMPFPIPETRRENRAGVRRLGDLVHKATAMVGISECDACRKRKRLLNRIVVWGWWRKDE